MKLPYRIRKIIFMLMVIMLLISCAPETNQPTSIPATLPQTQVTQPMPKQTQTAPPAADLPKADVLAVTVSGEPGAYNFSVQIASPDLGCQQYADWWEVLDEDGNLLYRRILAHSHVNEQPFTRSGGPASLDGDTVVWVRAHMNPGGYGGAAMKGTAANGFVPGELSPDFAAGLAESPPLPDGCSF